MIMGLHIDGKLAEREDDGSPKYSLAELLLDPNDEKAKREMNKATIEMFKMMAAMSGSKGVYRKMDTG